MTDFVFKKRVLFIGVPDMAYVGLEKLLDANVNIVGVVGPLKTHNTYNAFKNFVLSKHLNFIEYDKLNDSDLLEKLDSLNIDIAVVCSFNNKIPKIFMDKIKDGIVNVHPSLLPKYRGGNPYSWVIINGEKETGVTLHFMSENFDDGDIISQTTCELLPDETMGTLFNRTNEIGANMLLKALVTYENQGFLPRRTQPEGDFISAPNIKDNQTFLNYNYTAIQLERLIRGLNPYLSAMTAFNGEVLRIHKARVENIENESEFENGQICKVDSKNVYIKTKQGCLVPEVIQYSGFIIGDCSDFIKIAQPKIGDKFINGYT